MAAFAIPPVSTPSWHGVQLPYPQQFPGPGTKVGNAVAPDHPASQVTTYDSTAQQVVLGGVSDSSA